MFFALFYEDNMMSKVSRCCVDNKTKLIEGYKYRIVEYKLKHTYFENLTKIIIVKSFSLALSIPLSIYFLAWRPGGDGEIESEERGKQNRRRGGNRTGGVGEPESEERGREKNNKSRFIQ